MANDDAAVPLVDTHCHFDVVVAEGHPADALLERAQGAGLQWLVNPAITLDAIPRVLALAEQYDPIYAGVAIHPCDVHQETRTDWKERLEPFLSHPKVVAVGETGLDYYWDATTEAVQIQFLRTFYELAQAYGLPIILHSRGAAEDFSRSTNQALYGLAKDYPEVVGIMHCFSGDAAMAEAMAGLGYFISFAGNLTFKKATNLHEAAQVVPDELLLIETDAPYLSPMPHRGQHPNEPARVVHVAEKLAELRQTTVEAIGQQTTANAYRVFGKVPGRC